MGSVGVVDVFREGTSCDSDSVSFGEHEKEVMAIKTGTHLYVARKERCATRGEHSSAHRSPCESAVVSR